jgi:hypothetical protein
MNNFKEIESIIEILNPKISKSSESSMLSDYSPQDDVSTDSELIELLNDTNNSSYLCSTKRFTTFNQEQHQSTRLNNCDSFKRIDQTEEDVIYLLNKGHRLINQLNNENIKLIDHNKRLNKELKSKNTRLALVKQSCISLKEQNKSLKEQLTISQVYNVAYLEQIKLSNKQISKMTVELNNS